MNVPSSCAPVPQINSPQNARTRVRFARTAADRATNFVQTPAHTSERRRSRALRRQLDTNRHRRRASQRSDCIQRRMRSQASRCRRGFRRTQGARTRCCERAPIGSYGAPPEYVVVSACGVRPDYERKEAREPGDEQRGDNGARNDVLCHGFLIEGM